MSTEDTCRAIVSGEPFEIQTATEPPSYGVALMPDGIYVDGQKLPGLWADHVRLRIAPKELIALELRLFSVDPLYMHPDLNRSTEAETVISAARSTE